MEIIEKIKEYIRINIIDSDVNYSKSLYSRNEYIDDIPKGLIDLKKKVLESWTESVFRIIDKNGWKDSEVYKRAGISKQTFSRMRINPEYKPEKDTVIQLCFGLMLNIDESLDLLNKAGFFLSKSIERDLALRYLIEKKIYNIVIINEILDRLGYRVFNVN